MARTYGRVSVSIWRSRRFLSLPSDEARLFYLYLHTCPHVNSIGCFWLPKGYVQVDLKWSAEVIDRAIRSCIDTGLIAYDDTEEVVLIERFLEHSPITNGKHALGSARHALDLPRCALKDRIINVLRADKYGAAVESLLPQERACDSPIHSPSDTTEPEPEPELSLSGDRAVVDEAFDRFWKTYPRRDGANPKQPARDKFARWVGKGAEPDDLIAAAEAYRRECEDKGQIGTPYVAQAVTWLNQRRWEDYAVPDPPEAEKSYPAAAAMMADQAADCSTLFQIRDAEGWDAAERYAQENHRRTA